MEQKTDKITVEELKAKRIANLKTDAGPGRPKGQRNYATIRAEAIKAIALQNNKTPEEIEEMLLAKGMAEALKGDFRFYKDDLDRVHGSATQLVKQETTIMPVLVKFLNSKDDTNSNGDTD